MKPDQYIECHLLLAVMNNDVAEANRLLGDLENCDRHALMDYMSRMRAGIINGRFTEDPGAAALPRAIHGDTQQ